MRETNFKQTEIGLIPEDWTIRTVFDVAPLQRGFDLPSTKLCHGEYPVVYSNGIGFFHNEYKCKAPGLITGRSGTIGRFTLITERAYWPHNTTLWVTDFKSNDPTFLYYCYSSLNFEEAATGTGVPTLNRNYLRDKKIALPPTEEQKRIGSYLMQIDDLVRSVSELIDKKRSIKSGAMTNLLSGRLRLPGFSDPWVSSTLDEIGYIIPNNTLARDMLADHGVIKNIHYGDVLIKYGAVLDLNRTTVPFIHESLNDRFLKSVHAKDGDVIFADTAEDETVGKATEITNVENKLVISGLHTYWYRPYIEFAKAFLGYACNSRDFHAQVIPVISGTKVCSISKPSLLSFTIYYPSDLNEQQAIANVLTDMDDEISALEAKLKKYEQLKQGMMQQLLTGKIRLVSPNESQS